MRLAAGVLAMTLIAASPGTAAAGDDAGSAGYEQLLALFAEWRAFEQPKPRNGAPDYTAATLARQHAELKFWQARLAAIEPGGWSVERQVDWHLVWAEMNGFDFNLRVLKPWQRDPAFYKTVWTEQSDTPAHEGPTHHQAVELWTYAFPLSPAAEVELAAGLGIIPPLLEQARLNLTGNARDLWVSGIGTIRQQVADLDVLAETTTKATPALRHAVHAARQATVEFVAWLEQQAPAKTGPSGIGKDHYTWSLRNVHLVPLSWEEEVTLLERELARAHAALRLEEHRNRALPPLRAIGSPEEFEHRTNQAVSKYMEFLADREIVEVRDYMDPALRAKRGSFVPEAQRNFFWIATHLEPMTLYTHFYHWWDLARMREDPHPSPIRRGPLLYNIWDSRAEGMSTAMEEIVMHAGYYDDNPRAREIVWIMLAQRAARGLGSLYAHANEFTMKQAADFHVAWTPRGWMRKDLDLLGFEQQLYLRQPGYGSSYVTGKHLMDELLKDRSRQLGDGFALARFFGEMDAAGMIPVSLLRWQLTGNGDEVRSLVRAR